MIHFEGLTRIDHFRSVVESFIARVITVNIIQIDYHLRPNIWHSIFCIFRKNTVNIFNSNLQHQQL